MDERVVLLGMAIMVFMLVFAADGAASGTAMANATIINGTSGVAVANSATASNYVQPEVLNASNQSIMLAGNITIGKVGADYFHKYMSFRDGYTYLYQNGTNLTVVFFTYNIPFINGTATTGVLAGGPVINSLGTVVLFDNGNLINYIGPAAPYVVNTSTSVAFSVAKQFGLQNVTGSYITAVWSNSTTYNSTAGYRLSWAVFEMQLPSNGFPDGKIVGVYVDIGRPAVLGEFVYNPAILKSQPGINLNKNIIGNFTAFQLGNNVSGNNGAVTSTFTGASLSQQSVVEYGIAMLFIFLFIIYAVRRRS